MRVVKHSCGFTLLEVLIAMLISSLVLSATYFMLIQILSFNVDNEEHDANLNDLLFIKRIMTRDFENCKTLVTTEIWSVDKFTLRCPGDVVRFSQLGAEVKVVYKWRKSKNKVVLERLLLPINMTDKVEQNVISEHKMVLHDSLSKLDYQILQGTEWDNGLVYYKKITAQVSPLFSNLAKLNDKIKIENAVIRWQLQLGEMGRWDFVFPLKVKLE